MEQIAVSARRVADNLAHRRMAFEAVEAEEKRLGRLLLEHEMKSLLALRAPGWSEEKLSGCVNAIREDRNGAKK